MAITLDSVFTSSTYNSYLATIEEINDIVSNLDGVIDGINKWTELDSDNQKTNVWIAAVKDLNSFEFVGVINSSINSPFNMKWPRTGTCYVNGIKIGSSEIPQFILEYLSRRVIESLLYDENEPISRQTKSHIKKQKVGSLEQEFFDSGESGGTTINLREMPSFQCIKPYVTGATNSNLNFLIRS